MKNSAKLVLILALTAASAASCHKEIAVRGEGSGELTLNPQMDALTKAPLSGTTFPDTRTIVLSAYNTIPGGTSGNFFQDITFKKNATLGSWVGGGGSDPKYWPVSGTLDLLAYSADGFTSALTPAYNSTNCSTDVTLTVPAENKTKQVNILFAGATGKSASGSALPMTFKHAEAVVAFNAKGEVPYDATSNLGVTINSITLEGVKTYGTVKLKIDGTCEWSGGTAENVNLPGIPSGGYNVTGDYIPDTTPFAIGNTGLIVIPQTATSFTVSYTVHYGRDASSGPIDKTETFTYTIPSTIWEAGKEYVYQLEFKQNQILVATEILKWTVIPGGETVPETVSATFKDFDGTKTDIDLCAPGIPAKLSANAIVGIDWGDGRRKIIKNTTGSEMTLTSIPHTYSAAPSDSVKIFVRGGTLDFGIVAENSHYDRFYVYNTAEVIIALNLSASETANSYIVSKKGAYVFKATVKGNGSGTDVNLDPTGCTPVVLWESFGTSEKPSVGALVKKESVTLKDDYVKFEATEKKGNALIAVKDAGGTILWSWHIWLTDTPADQEYQNGAGTMMDRNLGATAAVPGSTDAVKLKTYGLLYEWGRKDPFLGGNGVSSNTQAASTLASWPLVNGSSTGASDGNNVAYSVMNPTTIIRRISSSNYDWTTEHADGWSSTKTIFDPCPPGYRVPDGGPEGVWAKADFSTTTGGTFDKGYYFDVVTTTTGTTTTWYPAAGSRGTTAGTPRDVGASGSCWSCTNNGNFSYSFNFGDGSVSLASNLYRSNSCSVRCVKD